MSEIRHISSGFVPVCIACGSSLGYVFDTEHEAKMYAAERLGRCQCCRWKYENLTEYKLTRKREYCREKLRKLEGREDEIRMLVENGERRSIIAQKMHCSKDTLSVFIRDKVFPDGSQSRKGRPRKLDDFRDEIMTMLRQEVSQAEIARRIGVSSSALSRYLQRTGYREECKK